MASIVPPQRDIELGNISTQPNDASDDEYPTPITQSTTNNETKEETTVTTTTDEGSSIDSDVPISHNAIQQPNPTHHNYISRYAHAVISDLIDPDEVDQPVAITMFDDALQRLQEYLNVFEWQTPIIIENSPEGMTTAIQHLMENVRLQLRLNHRIDHFKKQKYWYLVLALLLILLCWVYSFANETYTKSVLAKAKWAEQRQNYTIDFFKMNKSLTRCASQFNVQKLKADTKIQHQNDLLLNQTNKINTQNNTINARIEEIKEIKKTNAISIAKLKEQFKEEHLFNDKIKEMNENQIAKLKNKLKEEQLSTGGKEVIRRKSGECKNQLNKRECDIISCSYRTSQGRSCRPSNPMNLSMLPKGCFQWDDGSIWINVDDSPSNQRNLCTDKAVCICAKLEEKMEKKDKKSEFIKKVIGRCGKSIVVKEECDAIITQMNNENAKNGIPPYTVFPEFSKVVHERFSPTGCYIYNNQQFYFNTNFDDQSSQHSVCSTRNTCICHNPDNATAIKKEEYAPTPSPKFYGDGHLGGTRRKLRKTKKKQKKKPNKKPKKKPKKKSKRKPKKIKNLTKRDNYKKK
jgi:hypothetical protein